MVVLPGRGVVAGVLAGVLLAVLLSGCVAEPGDEATQASVAPAPLPSVALADPFAAGPFKVLESPYDLGSATVGGNNASHQEDEYEARLRGQLYAPEGDGPFPLLVFLHGQHYTCSYRATTQVPDLVSMEDCSEAGTFEEPFPSHLGYAYLARNLASNGYVVASILGYEVNARNGDDVGMWARGELVLATIDALAAHHQDLPVGAGHVDFTRIGLMGHSRGGEGVVTASLVDLARPPSQRWPLKGIVALAPTDFNGNAPIDTPFLTILPYCDGDVTTLMGATIFDHARARGHNVSVPLVQALVLGADHNLYNTMWADAQASTPAGDAIVGEDLLAATNVNRHCQLPSALSAAGGGRLSASEQRQEAVLHIGGFLRWTVGGEQGFAPYFMDGTPGPACPATVACTDAHIVTSQWSDGQAVWRGNDAPGIEPTLEGFASSAPCAEDGCDPTMMSGAAALHLKWQGKATLDWDLAALPTAPQGHAVTLRFAVPPPAQPPADGVVRATVRVELADGTPHAAALEGAALRPAPEAALRTGADVVLSSKLVLSEVRAVLPPAAAQQALRSITVELESDAGDAFVTDLLVE